MKNTDNKSETLRQKAEELLKKKSEDKILELIEELAFQNEEKAKRADELIIANKELAFQNEEKTKRADELSIANKELVFQNEEKAKRANELGNANKELAFEQENLRKIASLVPGVVYQYLLRPDGTSCFPYASEAINDIYGVSPDEVREDASKVFANLHPDDLAGVAASIQASAKDLTPWQHEYRVTFKDGTIRSLYGNALPQREADGSVLWHGFITDITARLSAEKAGQQLEEDLKQVSARLELATRAGGVGVWDYDIVNNILFWDDQMFSLYGITRKDFIGVYEAWQNGVHPDDKERGDKEIQMAILGEKEFDTEFRVIWPDSSIHNIRALAIVQCDESGKALRMIGTNWDITKIRKAEKEKLDDSESRYRSIFQGSPDGILIADEETKMIVFANPAQCKLLGYTEDELKTMTIAGIHPANTFPDTLAGFESIAHGEKTMSENIQCLRKNGEIFYSDIAPSFITINSRKCVVGFFRDITQRRHAEDKLKNNAALLTNLIINLHEGVLLEDSNRKILLTNQLFCDMFGIPAPPETILGADCTNAAEESKALFKDPGKFIADINVILADKNTALNNELELLDGRFFERDYIPTFLDNEYSGHLWKYRDITQRKQAEIALKEALVKAESGDRLKTAFLQNISHEVRTPLNGILGFGNLLAEPDLTSEEKQNYTRFLKASSDRLINTITDYIDISLIVTGNVEVSLKAVNTTNVLKELQTRFQHDCDAKNIMLKLEIPKDQEHFTLITDPELLRKSISCLMTNAIKFTNHGTVTIGCSIKSQTIEFFVIDTGIGIDSEVQEKIFEPFVHESMSETRAYQGSGLGLPIIKGFLKLLGGEIRLESEKGKGAAFFFSLPLEQGTTQENEPIDPLIGHVEIIRPVILVAEDDLYSDFYMEVILKSIASIVIKAANGKEAVEMCRLHPEISIVLMDVKMPVMDGLEATRQIKSFRKDLPVIAVTAYALSRDKKKALDAGCDDFLSKPVSKKELLEKLKKLGFVV